jgi:hypothetical protein
MLEQHCTCALGTGFKLVSDKMEFLSLWLTCIGEKGRSLGKTYGIKVR